LHIHSTASDGCWSPEQLVEQVQRAGIGCFAVTDHDTVAGVAQAEALARQRGLAFVRGVEVSSKLDGRLIHILGYGFDLTNEPFRLFLQTNETALHGYDDSSIQMLIDAGYSIDYAEYERYTWDRSRGGWKALNFLIDIGLCRDVHSFFGELFTGDLQLTFPDFPPPADVIQHICQAGGISVWAHPGGSSLSKGPRESSEKVLAQMLEAGIQGIECYACHHDAEWTRRCLEWAERYDLLITGGSDSHGGFVGRRLGRPEVHLNDLRLGPLVSRGEASWVEGVRAK